MGESDNNKAHKKDSGDIEKLAAEYSYLDYLIEKKFYKKYWGHLRATVVVIGLVLTVIAIWGITTVSELSERLERLRDTDTKIQATYSDLLKRDSLQTYIDENSNYYAIYLAADWNLGRNAANELLGENGFSFASPEFEDSLTWLLDLGKTKFWFNNDAYRFVRDTAGTDLSLRRIGVVYHNVPSHIRGRLDSLYRVIYAEPVIGFFEDTRLPGSGFVFYIE